MNLSTPERILLATETLFGERGYSSTTLRAVTKEAGVNLAAVNYHFGGKEKLFEAMISSRVSELNSLRLKLLKEERNRLVDKPMSLEKIFSILLHPLEKLLVRNGELDVSFLKMIARFLTEPSPFIKKLHQDFFHEIKVAFSSEVARTLPNESAEELAWKFYISATCMMGSITQYNSFTQWNHQGDHVAKMHTLINHVILFIVAGMSANLTRTDWIESLPYEI